MASENLKKALLASAQEEYLDIDKKSETIEWSPSEHFTAQMDELVRRSDKRRFNSVKKVLLVAAVVFLISVISVFSFADVRENVINQFKDYYNTHFDLEYGIDEAGDIAVGGGINDVYTLAIIPEGFVEVQFNRNDHSAVTVWENADGDTLVLSQGDGITKRSVDVERLERVDAVSLGVHYEMYEEDGYILMLWNTSEYTFSIDYYGNETPDRLVAIADSLTEVKK